MIDVFILVLCWVIILLLLLIFVPREKVRDAWVIFLFKQVVTWGLGLIAVERKWLEYPVREFPYANRTSFTFEFFAYPAICVLFNLHYPEEKGWFRQVIHYVLYTSAITVFEVILENYTGLIHYIKWDWYWTFLIFFIQIYSTHRFYLWFKKGFVKKRSV